MQLFGLYGKMDVSDRWQRKLAANHVDMNLSTNDSKSNRRTSQKNKTCICGGKKMPNSDLRKHNSESDFIKEHSNGIQILYALPNKRLTHKLSCTLNNTSVYGLKMTLGFPDSMVRTAYPKWIVRNFRDLLAPFDQGRATEFILSMRIFTAQGHKERLRQMC